MFRWNSRRVRRSGRNRVRPVLGAVEGLEARALLAYSPLGFSLPDLTIQGAASSAASWGGQVTITATVDNIGSSTLNEPLALDPNVGSSADAAATTAAVYASRTPNSLKGAVLVGELSIPAVSENNFVQTTQTITLPSQPLGFPGQGGRIYLTLQANSTGNVYESTTTNNLSKPIPLRIEANLPELAVVGFDVPPVMQGGDVIQPNIRVANLGTANTPANTPVTISLVASPTRTLVAGDYKVITTYAYNGVIQGGQTVASTSSVNASADANQTPQQNVITFAGNDVILPTSSRPYYLGVVVDINNTIPQLGTVGEANPRPIYSLPRLVNASIKGLPAASAVLTAGGAANVPTFPYALNNQAVGSALGTTLPTSATATSANASNPAAFDPVASNSSQSWSTSTAAVGTTSTTTTTSIAAASTSTATLVGSPSLSLGSSLFVAPDRAVNLTEGRGPAVPSVPALSASIGA